MKVAAARPWPYATVLFVVLLVRGIADPVGTVVDRLGQFLAVGLGFVGAMILAGVASRWLGRRGAVFRVIEWALVVALAVFGGALLGYLAVVENLVFCVDPDGRATDCNSSMTERVTLVVLALAGWAAGAWIGLPARRWVEEEPVAPGVMS